MLHQIPRFKKTTQFNYCNASKDAKAASKWPRGDERNVTQRHATVARANVCHTAEEEERSAGNGTNDPVGATAKR